MLIHVWTVSFSYVYLFMKGKTYTPTFRAHYARVGAPYFNRKDPAWILKKGFVLRYTTSSTARNGC